MVFSLLKMIGMQLEFPGKIHLRVIAYRKTAKYGRELIYDGNDQRESRFKKESVCKSI